MWMYEHIVNELINASVGMVEQLCEVKLNIQQKGGFQ